MRSIGRFICDHPIITFLIVDGVLATVQFVTKAVITKGECFNTPQIIETSNKNCNCN